MNLPETVIQAQKKREYIKIAKEIDWLVLRNSECKIYVYVLRDPRKEHPRYEEVRYVGQAVNPKHRYTCHLNQSKKKNRRIDTWIRKLKEVNLYPKMEVFEAVEKKDANLKEIFWISNFKNAGCDLVNLTNGGEGTRGVKPTEKQIKIWKEKFSGKPGKLQETRTSKYPGVSWWFKKSLWIGQCKRFKKNIFFETYQDEDMAYMAVLEGMKKHGLEIPSDWPPAPMTVKTWLSKKEASRSRKLRKTSSEYYGVYFVKSKRRWRSIVRISKGIYKLVGNFHTEIEAAIAYDKKIKELGLQTNLNFPDHAQAA